MTLPPLTEYLAANEFRDRPPMSERETSEPVPDRPASLAAHLPSLLASNDPGDRLRAYIYAQKLATNVTLPPGTWCVVETNPRRSTPSVWSAHTTREDADLWCTAWQVSSDAQVARHGWGADAMRTFTVAQRDDALVTSLKLPGADPVHHARRIFS